MKIIVVKISALNGIEVHFVATLCSLFFYKDMRSPLNEAERYQDRFDNKESWL